MTQAKALSYLIHPILKLVRFKSDPQLYSDKGIFLLTHVPSPSSFRIPMDLVSFYKCLGDATRLRIVNLLLKGPLCVCQIQEVLQEPQVKTSKHLGYMKSRGLLAVVRKANWNFYEIATELRPVASACLQAIEAHASEETMLAADLDRLQQTQSSECC